MRHCFKLENVEFANYASFSITCARELHKRSSIMFALYQNCEISKYEENFELYISYTFYLWICQFGSMWIPNIISDAILYKNLKLTSVVNEWSRLTNNREKIRHCWDFSAIRVIREKNDASERDRAVYINVQLISRVSIPLRPLPVPRADCYHC